MKNFIVTIGIEVHTVLKTKTKMFSSSANKYANEINTNVSFMDLALPGVLPLINKVAVQKSITLADALDMQINYKNIAFDRKNYFYPDLPKGFQITQQYNPIGTEGTIQITDAAGNLKNIEIERIHMEEDTAKQIMNNGQRFMDYNRAGVPLVEIVTKPCINDAHEAMAFLNALRTILIFKDISDAKMENGSLRADVNISVRLQGETEYGTKVEIKNINSINNVGKAIEFEIKRQTNAILNGVEIKQETRRFNDTTMTTEFLREKTNAVDYRYMTDPNVFHFKLSDEEVKEIIKNSPLSPKQVSEKLSSLGLDANQISSLLDNYDLCSFIINGLNQNVDAQLLFNWVNSELVGQLNKNNLTLNDMTEAKVNEFFKLLSLLSVGDLNNKQAKTLLENILTTSKTVQELITELGFEQIKDEKVLQELLNKFIEANAELVSQYEERPERVEKFLVGMIMKETKSQAHPVITMELVKKTLNSK
ncbi:MAG: Asp-tRNA(Asn)/Glu-tRNA(Gln) amidotransferase subunit GatB [Mycoplasma sp.]